MTMTTTRTGRPLLGLRRTPGRLMLTVFRIPLFLYHRGRGEYLGRTFLRLVHVGRRTGAEHEMVAMVLGDDLVTGEVVICSGWGPDVDWLRNLHAGPAKRVDIGCESFVPVHRFLTEDEAVSVAVDFRLRHPHRMRLIATILGWGDLWSDAGVRRFIAGHPFVAFRPA
jgi:deazaflavin-dependent oxidoreductase (nitroreductase family)